jgi:hypothetical protein
MDNASTNSPLEELQFTIEEHGVQISDILAEARQFTTVAGLTLGFLLAVSIAYSPQFPGVVRRALLVLALTCTASATLIFILPPLYHHLRFPMDKKQILQFYWRSHKFILWGIVPLYAGIFFSVFLALYNVVGVYAVILAMGILIVPFIVYELRKIGDPKELRGHG